MEESINNEKRGYNEMKIVKNKRCYNEVDKIQFRQIGGL